MLRQVLRQGFKLTFGSSRQAPVTMWECDRVEEDGLVKVLGGCGKDGLPSSRVVHAAPPPLNHLLQVA